MTAGTFRVGDGARVDFSQAKEAWAAAARTVLLSVARRYHETVTYKDLALEIQAATGIRTKVLITNWIGGVLGKVADECFDRNEPLLSALCVRADGTIGDGYATAEGDTYGLRPTSIDIEMRAAEERLRCYRFFGAVLPADGGQPALTAQVLAKRERIKRQATAPAPTRVCPTCWMALPMSGGAGFNRSMQQLSRRTG